MATFNAQINDLVGAFTDTAAITQFLRDGVRQLVNVLPPNRIDDILTVQALNGSTSTFSLNDSENNARGNIVSVSRQNVNGVKQLCRQIPISLVSRASDPEDLMFISATDPAYYISGGVLNVLPTPTNSQTAEVVFVPLTAVSHSDEQINGFPNDLEYIVVLYAAIKCAQSLLAIEEDDELYVPIITTLKQDYAQALNLLGVGVQAPKGTGQKRRNPLEGLENIQQGGEE
tara:strand:+ start:85 stop:774 length:690 start_codon:yes stop_codon:yes gene_type:complete